MPQAAIGIATSLPATASTSSGEEARAAGAEDASYPGGRSFPEGRSPEIDEAGRGAAPRGSA